MGFIYGTRATRLVRERIEKGKSLQRKSMNVEVVFVADGEYYYVRHYRTIVAIGRKGEAPFACRTCGWNTKCTLGLLRSLGFCLEIKRIQIGEPHRNPKTNRMKRDFDRVLHISGAPMLDSTGLNTAYDEWWDKAGCSLGKSHFF